MGATATNSAESRVFILFADPSQPPAIYADLAQIDALCVDLDHCQRKADGSLGDDCVALLHRAKEMRVDVVLAAKRVRFYEVRGLDRYHASLIEKPNEEITGEELAHWVGVKLSHLMRLDSGYERGVFPLNLLPDVEPGPVDDIHFQSVLTREQQEDFLKIITGEYRDRKEQAVPKAVPAKPSPKIATSALTGPVKLSPFGHPPQFKKSAQLFVPPGRAREFRAEARLAHLGPQQPQIVLNMIQGLRVGQAFDKIQYRTGRSAQIVGKALRSALKNAEHLADKQGLDVDLNNLYVQTAVVAEESRMKGFRYSPLGRGLKDRRRIAHIVVTVGEKSTADFGMHKVSTLKTLPNTQRHPFRRSLGGGRS